MSTPPGEREERENKKRDERVDELQDKVEAVNTRLGSMEGTLVTLTGAIEKLLRAQDSDPASAARGSSGAAAGAPAGGPPSIPPAAMPGFSTSGGAVGGIFYRGDAEEGVFPPRPVEGSAGTASPAANTGAAAAAARRRVADPVSPFPAAVRPAGEMERGGGAWGFGPTGERSADSRLLTAVKKESAPSLKGRDYRGWENAFLLKAKFQNLDGQFMGDSREVPVGDVSKCNSDLQRDGYSPDEILSANRAYEFLVSALQAEQDKGLTRSYHTPKGLLRALRERHAPKTQESRARLYNEITQYRFSYNLEVSPLSHLDKIEEKAARLAELGSPLDQQLINTVFLNALPSEYGDTAKQLQLMEESKCTRAEIIRMVSADYNRMLHLKKKQPKVRGQEQAFAVSDGGRARQGGRGGGGGSSRRRGGKGDGESGKGSSGGGSSSGSGGRRGGAPRKSGNQLRPDLCFRCNHPGHRKEDCKTPEKEFRQQCETCFGFGHGKEDCKSEPQANLVMAVSGLTVPGGGLGAGGDETDDVGGNVYMTVVPAVQLSELELACQLGGRGQGESGGMLVLADSGATTDMFNDPSAFSTFREVKSKVCLGGTDNYIDIVGVGDVVISTVPEREGDPRDVNRLRDVLCVPELGYNLIAINQQAMKGHGYTANQNGLTVQLDEGKMFFRFAGKLPVAQGYPIADEVATANAVIAPGQADTLIRAPVDRFLFHCANAHANDRRLEELAKSQGIRLTPGPLKSCTGCSLGKAIQAPIQRSTETRAVKPFARLFVDLSGRMRVPSIGGMWYILIVRDDYSRWTRVYFLRHKSDAAKAFAAFLAEVRHLGILVGMMVLFVRSDNGGEFSGKAFRELCLKWGIKQEFTPPYSPKYNGVAERALGMIMDIAMASRVQAKEMYPDAPTHEKLWAEAVACACHAMNCTPTTANPENKSPWEMIHGSPPPIGATQPFLRPVGYRVNVRHKSDTKGRIGWYLGPSHKHHISCFRILNQDGKVDVTRNYTWRSPTPYVPPSPSSPQELPPIAEVEVESGEGTDGEEGEGTSSPGGGGEGSSDDDELDPDSTVLFPVLPPAREAPAAVTGSGGGAAGATSDIPVSFSENESGADGAGMDFGGGPSSSSSSPDESDSGGSSDMQISGHDSSSGGNSRSVESSGSSSSSSSGSSSGSSHVASSDSDGNGTAADSGEGGNNLPRGEERRLEWSSGHPILPTRTRHGGAGANLVGETSAAPATGDPKPSPRPDVEETLFSWAKRRAEAAESAPNEIFTDAEDEEPYTIPPALREEMLQWADQHGLGGAIAEFAAESLARQHAQEEQANMVEARLGRDAIHDALGGGQTPAHEYFSAGELGGGDFGDAELAAAAAAADPTYGGGDMEAPAPASDIYPQLSDAFPSPIGKRPCDVESVPLTEKDVQGSKFRVFWEEAKRAELDGHDETGTFSFLEAMPEDKRPIRMKFVFAWKTDSDGLIVKCKARLVAIGCSQEKGVDFFHSSSPCPNKASIKVVVAVATEKDYPISHWDVKQAYIRAPLKEEVFLKFPPGCGEKSGKVVKAERALYGLKQSGREWGYKLADELAAEGYEQCKADPCLFRKVVDGEVKVVVVTYVDDIMAAGPKEETDALYRNLSLKFPMTDLGACTWYDGCAIMQDREKGITTISQSAYAASLMTRFGITDVSDVPASPTSSDELGPKREDEPGGNWPVREAVGGMMWLATFTRPDIANAVRAVARQAHAPAERHWRAAKKILAYLNGTQHYGITYKRGSGLGLELYVDASYADKATERKSVTGVAVMVGEAAVAASSKTQPIVATSTSEAEYLAAAEGVKEALFVRGVLAFAAPKTSGASIMVREDNKGAISLIENPLSSARSKHIDVRYHFLRDLFRSKTITVAHVESKEQHADLLTKALPKEALLRHSRFLMNLPS